MLFFEICFNIMNLSYFENFKIFEGLVLFIIFYLNLKNYNSLKKKLNNIKLNIF